RVAADTAKQAARAAAAGADPRAAAQAAAVSAVRRHAPGLLAAGSALAGAVPAVSGLAGTGLTTAIGATPMLGRRAAGRWVRQGHRVIVYGAGGVMGLGPLPLCLVRGGGGAVGTRLHPGKPFAPVGPVGRG